MACARNCSNAPLVVAGAGAGDAGARCCGVENDNDDCCVGAGAEAAALVEEPGIPLLDNNLSIRLTELGSILTTNCFCKPGLTDSLLVVSTMGSPLLFCASKYFWTFACAALSASNSSLVKARVFALVVRITPSVGAVSPPVAETVGSWASYLKSRQEYL